jgi:hypothetical protein
MFIYAMGQTLKRVRSGVISKDDHMLSFTYDLSWFSRLE